MILPSQMSELLAEEIGWHLGDGSMNIYNGKGLYQLRGHLVDDRSHYENVIKPVFKQLFGVTLNLRKMQNTGVFGFQLWSDDLVAFKRDLGLPLGPKGECALPREIFDKKEFIIAAIRGIFDTDGSIFLEKKRGKLYPRVEIKQTSRLLASQLYEELLKLGFRVTHYVNPRGYERWQPVQVISVRGNEELERWMNVICPRNQKHINKAEILSA